MGLSGIGPLDRWRTRCPQRSKSHKLSPNVLLASFKLQTRLVEKDWDKLTLINCTQLFTQLTSSAKYKKMKDNCDFALGILSGQNCCSSGLKDQLQSKSSRCSALQQDINRNSGHRESGSLGNAMHAVPKIGPTYVATGPRLPVATLVSQVSIWGVCNTTTMYNADIRSINLRYHPALGNSPEAIAVWS